MSKEIMKEKSQDDVVDLVEKAKHRPLPRSSKALFVVVVLAMLFTGGIAYGKHQATASSGAGLTLTALGGGGGFGGAGGFGGRGQGGAGGGGAGGGNAGTGNAAAGAGAGTTTATVAADVAGTVVSITPTSVVVTTLDGSKQTFPITATTRVRTSTTMPLSGVKPGDIVTIKPDTTNGAKTIMVVK